MLAASPLASANQDLGDPLTINDVPGEWEGIVGQFDFAKMSIDSGGKIGVLIISHIFSDRVHILDLKTIEIVDGRVTAKFLNRAESEDVVELRVDGRKSRRRPHPRSMKGTLRMYSPSEPQSAIEDPVTLWDSSTGFFQAVTKAHLRATSKLSEIQAQRQPPAAK
jgi:hypothetical protein